MAWLHVTNACNLDCAYCYLARSSEAMDPEMGRQAIEAIFRSALLHRFSGVKLKYAGGEPTLRFPLVIDLHRQAYVLADQHSLALDGVILSNGVGITPMMIKALHTLGLRLTISLDGLGEYQNCSRPLINGQGSFAEVSRSIELCLKHGLVPKISVTVSGRNLNGLPELIQWILDRELPFSLEFYRETDQSANFRDLVFEAEPLIETMRRVFQILEANLPHRSLCASLVDRANLGIPHLRPCAAGSNYLVIDHRGRIAKCQMDIQNTITDIHDPDPLRRIQEDKSGIQNLSVDEKLGCRDCEWRYWCAGGCPLVTYRATGRYDVKSPYCSIYKALYPEVIRLEGLRLLKYADKP